MSKTSNKKRSKNNKVKDLLDSKPQDGKRLDPSHKRKQGATSTPPIGSNGKPMRLIGASLGATVKIGDNYMRLDAWESRWVEDHPGIVEEQKRELFHELIQELILQQQEAEEELVDYEDD